MFRVLSCLGTEHDLRLVVLAGGICLLASIAAISLFRRAAATTGPVRIVWLTLAGVAAGCGIWATHFVAMLAYEPGVDVAYDISLTALSLALAMFVTGFGLSIAVYRPDRRHSIAGGAIVGGGVACMHYTGMFALELPGRISWAPELVAASILFGMLLGSASLVFAVRFEGKRGLFGSAVLLTLAIVSHHFIAMGAVDIIPDPVRVIQPFSLSPRTLALAVAAAAIVILLLCLAGAFADSRIQERDLQLVTAVNNMSHGVVMFDANERLVVCNDRYVEMYGLSRDVVKPGVTLRELVQHRKRTGTLNRDVDEYRAALLTSIAKGEATSWIVDGPDGRAISVTNRPMTGGSWVAAHEDITERRRAEDRIKYLAHHDPLTDLPNRVAFNERLEELIASANSRSGGLGLMCIDLDRFKEINDVFGHVTGDALLWEVGSRLRRAAGENFVARLGGDEFIVIVDKECTPAGIATLGDRVIASVSDELTVQGHQLRISLSAGVALYPNDGKNAAALVANADAALYRAKADGRGMVRFFEAEMDQKLRVRRAMQHDLRSAIEGRELKLHYQPQTHIDGEVVAFEALLRWHHPRRGFVPPAKFIPLAEESGVILQIGEWVLRSACREAASWSKPVRIGVNLSPVQFRHGDLPGLVHAILLETGLHPSRLELEITESVLIDDFSRTVSILRRLKTLGVRIAMDDFGTGYSSLSYLQAFPFDRIKIDQSFISKLKHSPQAATIVRAVIGLARGLKVPVVAEGVETEEQLQFLSAENCDEIQGYLVGRPEPIERYSSVVNGESRDQEMRAELRAIA